METKRTTPLKAIRAKCLDCSCGSSNEVKLCPITSCPLYPFREGHNPFKAYPEWTEERREAQRQAIARDIHSIKRGKTEKSDAEGKDTTEHFAE